MSAKELKRVGVMERVAAGTLPLTAAAGVLGLSYRQAKRIVVGTAGKGRAGSPIAARGARRIARRGRRRASGRWR